MLSWAISIAARVLRSELCRTLLPGREPLRFDLMDVWETCKQRYIDSAELRQSITPEKITGAKTTVLGVLFTGCMAGVVHVTACVAIGCGNLHLLQAALSTMNSQ